MQRKGEIDIYKSLQVIRKNKTKINLHMFYINIENWIYTELCCELFAEGDTTSHSECTGTFVCKVCRRH